MTFLCVCYYDVTALSKFAPADFQRMAEICAPHDEALKKSGKVRFIGSLGQPDEYKTLRARGNSVELVNGAYAETNEPFGAFFLVDAQNVDEAVSVARLHPGVHLAGLLEGGIEVRPVESFDEL